ncbi:MAG: LamG domain-containing protein, partial [Planctomycetota bacterium]
TFTDTGWDVFVGGDGDPPGRQLSVFSAVLDPGTYVFGTSSGNNFYVIGALPLPVPLRKAHNPIPPDGSRTPPTGEEGDGYYMLMQFTAGYGATTHTGYFSSNFEDVNDRSSAALLGSPPYPGDYPTGLYAGLDDPALPDHARIPLERGVTYYWVVDESNDTASYPGDVWSFTIASEKAWSPTPPDGAQNVPGDSVDLSWLLGDVDTSKTVSYDVYWGTDKVTVEAGTSDTARLTAATHTIVSLTPDTVYYWKVDTRLTLNMPPFSTTIIEGDTWQFKTKPFIAITDPTRIVWWKFDEESGDLVLDYSGYDNDGTITGGAQRVPGKIDKAIDIDGNGQRVECTLAGGVPTTVNPPEVSVAMWVNPDIVTTSDEWSTLFFVDESGSYGKIRCNIWPDGRWAFRAGQGNTSNDNIDAIGPAAVIGEWTHYVGMKVDNDAAYVYVDGDLGASEAFGAGGDLDPACWIGAGDDKTNNLFNGQIDDVQVFLRKLTEKEIKIMAGRLNATSPDPANGSGDAPRTPTLSWSPGAYVGAVNGNILYYGDSVTAVANRTATSVTLTNATYTLPLTLDLGQTFYWAVDTVNGLEKWPGEVWSFTVTNWLEVDNMETYTPWTMPGNNIFEAYRDGMGNCTAGNGNDTGANLTENIDTAFVWNGAQSMMYDYDNDGMVYNPCTMAQGPRTHLYSKIEAQVAGLPSGIGTNWTIQGVKALSLRFYGQATNDIEPMWVQLNGGAKVTYGDYDDEDPADITEESWHEWFIDLADFGVTLTNVTTFAIGIGTEGSATPGGAGKVYFDDFRLYTPVCMPSRHSAEMAKLDFAPVGAPDCVVNYEEIDAMADGWLQTDAVETGELLLYWKFDETAGTTATDSSGKGHHGDVNDVNGVSWTYDAERGQCLDFQGGDNVIDNDANDYMNGLRGLTIAAWVKNREASATDQGFIEFRNPPQGNDHRNIRYDAAGASTGGTSLMKCGVTVGTSAADETWQEYETASNTQTTAWQHLALTWTSGSDVKLYIDGVEDTTGAIQATLVGRTWGYDVVMVGKGSKDTASDTGWNGLVDDVQIYNYALSEAEINTVKGGGAIPPKSVHYPVPSPGDVYEEAPGSGVINFLDYAELLKNWLTEVKYPQ